MSNLKSWRRITHGSTLELSVEVPDGKIVSCGARCVDSNNQQVEYSTPQLQPGPARKKLSAGVEYSTRVRLEFADSCTAKIKAKVIKPGGQTHGTAYSYSVTANAGAVRRATIICRME